MCECVLIDFSSFYSGRIRLLPDYQRHAVKRAAAIRRSYDGAHDSFPDRADLDIAFRLVLIRSQIEVYDFQEFASSIVSVQSPDIGTEVPDEIRIPESFCGFFSFLKLCLVERFSVEYHLGILPERGVLPLLLVIV